MKRVIIIGKAPVNIPSPEELSVKDVTIYAATSLQEVRDVFKSYPDIDIAITGGGLELETRLEIVRFIFRVSDTVTVHLKDRATGPEGFLPFINRVLRGVVG